MRSCSGSCLTCFIFSTHSLHIAISTYLGRKRQFFENSGGSLRLKAAVSEKARLESIPDCPERVHDTSMTLKQVKANGIRDILEVIFGAKPGQGALVTELTASQCMFQIVRTIMENAGFGTNAVTTSLEHPSAFDAVKYYCEKTGREFRVAMASPKTGGVELDEILSHIDKNTTLLSVMSASNVTGYLFDIETISKEARKINPDIFIVSDAVQHMPHGVLDVDNCALDGCTFAPYKAFTPLWVYVFMLCNMQNLKVFSYRENRLWIEYNKLRKIEK